jgi:hypothetical protein
MNAAISALTPAQRLAEAVRAKNFYWRRRQDLDECARIDRVNEICTALCGGDAAAGRQLAQEAIAS